MRYLSDKWQRLFTTEIERHNRWFEGDATRCENVDKCLHLLLDEEHGLVPTDQYIGRTALIGMLAAAIVSGEQPSRVFVDDTIKRLTQMLMVNLNDFQRAMVLTETVIVVEAFHRHKW